MRERRIQRLYRLLPLLILLVLPAVRPVQAQDEPSPLPQVADAEQAFEQALEAFEQADYGMAYRRFRLVYSAYPLNRKTTAALLMAAKAQYRQGDYAGANETLAELIEGYPTSGYLDEARALQELARRGMALEDERASVRDLGIALPLTGDPRLTQAMFTGIRLAVDEHNDGGFPTVRMVFRDTRSNASGAREALNALAQEDVEAVIGPIFSDEARAAAEVAERAELVLVSPLATEESVSEDRQYVFQANPTITERGRRMARYAIEERGLSSFGIVAELQDRDSERMAEGFQDEALQLGAQVLFMKLLSGSRGWYSLPDELDPALLEQIDALYLPISGSNAPALIQAVLEDLASINAHFIVLGNKNWHDLNVSEHASRYLTTYTNDFYVAESDAAVRDFLERYRTVVGHEPAAEETRLAFTGYDVTRYLLQHLGSGPSLADALREAPEYRGIGTRIHFDGGNVNRALFIFGYRNDRVRLLN